MQKVVNKEVANLANGVITYYLLSENAQDDNPLGCLTFCLPSINHGEGMDSK